ncbi:MULTISPECIES: HD-GYP domain-containing protein [unclassified Agarivorans]|uniref:HD-GYP domain-containing protein n=1 Tax=unclassified Agarivorans TaxID=2636026 RepID=UPI0026E29216|nr:MULTISPECIES: HD-GYP domain-containing protein [unclassified Agarivorans]MDO6685343.1 HD-GYP domain-containing protein [Agarivorans sp. 3_MG-2023]MDO6715485.1 HD-GYP domain-containing protein [Agarivorans sp. 2_MG-2023]
MTSPKTDIRTIEIDALKKGMYVVSITSQSGKTSVAQSGRITQAEQVKLLKRKGVKVVSVDWSRSVFEDDSSQPKTTEINSASSKVKKLSGESEKLAAKKLFNEAKSLQTKFFRQLQQGEPIDIEPMERAAEGLIDSLENQSGAMLCLAKIRAKDKYLMEHSLNVGMLLAYFGRSLDMNKAVQKQLLMGGMLHDIGKINTPDEILHKPGKLTDDEFVIMREHVVHSHNILKVQEGISKIMLEIASNHHERLDGLGYPNKLKGEQLSSYTRMANIVDCYDALTADRVYKSGMPPTAAFRILLSGVGTQFDKVLVEKFIRCMGVYPVGTLVKLKSKKLGVVVERNELKPLQPIIKLVFNAATNTHTEVKVIDLSKYSHEEIEGAVSPRDYGISLDRFLAE